MSESSYGARRCSIVSVVRFATPSSESPVRRTCCGASKPRARSSRRSTGDAWYRYHALFQEFLLGELRRVEPDIIPKLHLRAADWYEANGSSIIALEHLLNTTERDRCVQLLTALVRPTYTSGHMSNLHRWLRTVGDTAMRDYPPLAVGAGGSPS